MTGVEQKKLLRSEAKRINESFTEEEIRASDERIMDKVLASEAFKKAKSIFVYVSLEKEPDTYRLIKAALEAGKTVCVPKCSKKPEMKAVRITSLDDLRPGRFGIPEPASDEAYEGKTDLSVVPCVRAAKDGRRLGHGGGFYDWFLQRNESYKLCLCRSRLLCDSIPVETFDVLMDEVVTD